MDYFVASRSGLDIESEEKLVKKVGGKFALTVLLQKRIVELNRGAPFLVPVDPAERNLRKIAYREILEGKIELASPEDLEFARTQEPEQVEAPSEGAPEGGKGSEVYGSDIKKIKERRIKELTKLLNPKS